MRKRRVVGRIHGMKYSWKGHKDRNRHKNRIKRSGQVRLLYVTDINCKSPPRKGEPVGAGTAEPFLGQQMRPQFVDCIKGVAVAWKSKWGQLLLPLGLCGLIFTLWECCGLCFQYYPTELAHSFLFCFCVYFFRTHFCLIGPFNYISLCESLLQPWYSPLWLTGLTVPTNKQTN